MNPIPRVPILYTKLKNFVFKKRSGNRKEVITVSNKYINKTTPNNKIKIGIINSIKIPAPGIGIKGNTAIVNKIQINLNKNKDNLFFIFLLYFIFFKNATFLINLYFIYKYTIVFQLK